MANPNHDTISQFNPGDIVHLKSGGPEMTIARIDRGFLHCFWHSGKKVEHDLLPVQILEKVLPGQHS